MKANYTFTDYINSQEIKELLENFWGKGNPVADYKRRIYPYPEARQLLKELKDQNKLNKKSIVNRFGGSLISFGFRKKEKLVAHSGLLIQPWGEAETTGSIVVPKYKEQGFMKGINTEKHKLLRLLASNAVDITSYAVIGSKSVYHAATLFNFPELDIQSVFCNVGPFVYGRNLEKVPRKENRYLSKLSTKEGVWMLSHSVQVIGLAKKKLPYIDRSVYGHLSKAAQKLCREFGFRVSAKKRISKKNNQQYLSPAQIDIHIIWVGIRNAAAFKRKILTGLSKGRTVIVRIPFIKTNTDTLQKVNALFNLSKEYYLVFTGISVVNGYWCACYATIRKSHHTRYVESLKLIKAMPERSLGKLASILYKSVQVPNKN